jgi:alanine racemase
MIDPATASAEIDLDALADNLAFFRGRVAPAQLMLAVKADAYGHGLIPCARTARAAGVDWLGVATPEEALALREAGDDGPVLFWLYGPETDLTPAVAAEVDATAQTLEQISRLAMAAATAEREARVHLKIDTGMSRNGAPAELWPDLCAAAAEAERSGALHVVGVWSHLASADEVGAPSVGEQTAAFESALAVAGAAGLRPDLRHLANSAAALLLPKTHYDLVRVGIAAYGIDPAPGLIAAAHAPLRQVMRLRAQLVNVKTVAAGTGVSYGLTWRTDHRTRLGLVPLGYADGIPRLASNRGEVGIDGGRAAIRGRVCMDQFVVELPTVPERRVELGDEIVIFGPGDEGEPTIADWAAWAETIGHEIVTGIGTRVSRVFRTRRGLPASLPERR